MISMTATLSTDLDPRTVRAGLHDHVLDREGQVRGQPDVRVDVDRPGRVPVPVERHLRVEPVGQQVVELVAQVLGGDGEHEVEPAGIGARPVSAPSS